MATMQAWPSAAERDLQRTEWKKERAELLGVMRGHVCVLRLVLRKAEALLDKELVPKAVLDVLAEPIPTLDDPADCRYDRRLRMGAELALATVIHLRPELLRREQTATIAGDLVEFVDFLCAQLSANRDELSKHYRRGIQLFEVPN